MRSRVYETVRLSVRLSVLPVIRPPHAAAAGLLASSVNNNRIRLRATEATPSAEVGSERGRFRALPAGHWSSTLMLPVDSKGVAWWLVALSSHERS